MKTVVGTRRWWIMGGTLALSLMIAAAWVGRRPPGAPPIAIGFEGLHTISEPSYPYGLFTITNRSARAIEWDGMVEAPLDSGFEFQQGLSSFRAGGTLAPGAKTQFQMLVAGKPGVPFRFVVDMHQSRALPIRLWIRVSEAIPSLKRLWNPAKVQLQRVYGDWCLAHSSEL